jgi:proton-translocating NADH-quinone oxidoreductase chain N
MKYFLYGALNSLIFIIGLILILYLNLDLTYSSIFYYITTLNSFDSTKLNTLVLSLYCIIVFFLFKLSIFPFHWWIQDVFQGAPTLVTAYIAIPSKIILIIIFIQLLTFSFYNYLNYLQNFLIIVSLITMFIGAFGILYQTNLKRFFAYSTINHMSYILLGLSCNTNNGLFAIIVYLIAYILMMLFISLLFLTIFDTKKLGFIYINQLKNLYYIKSTLPWLLSINFFSLIGVPPFAGFWGKYYIIQAILVEINLSTVDQVMSFNKWSVSLVIIILTSLITAGVYLSLIKELFFIETNNITIIKNNIQEFKIKTNSFFIWVYLVLFCLIFFSFCITKDILVYNYLIIFIANLTNNIDFLL